MGKKQTSKKENEIFCKALFTIPEYVGFEDESNGCSFTIKEGSRFDGHMVGTKVGRLFPKDNTTESFFVKDNENQSTEILDKLMKEVPLKEKEVTIRRNGELIQAIDLYIPYKVLGHVSDLPTVTDSYIDGCSNVDYDMAYELLFVAEDGFLRYHLMEHKTGGSFSMTFFDVIQNLEDNIEELFETKGTDFVKDEDGYRVAFYNDFGEKLFIEFESLREFLATFTSVRVVKLDRKIIR